ncbi:MAG TPA: FHA domain-containing protein [Phycisphaerae bacterium]|jgi:pSer/pThr/pTyr-binding forkhead associated (FHA) protein
MNARLIMFRQNGERRDFALSGARTIIGRNDDCDIRIPLPEISRRHAELLQSGDGLLLHDLGSANGTYVNNQRAQRHRLNPGDHLIVGPVVFTVQIDGAPETIRPVKTKLRHRAAAGQRAAAAVGPGGDLVVDNDDDPIRAIEALAGDTAHSVFEPLQEEDAAG